MAEDTGPASDSQRGDSLRQGDFRKGILGDDLIADSDTTVTDENGVERKIVEGQPVPADLREAYAGGGKSKSKK